MLYIFKPEECYKSVYRDCYLKNKNSSDIYLFLEKKPIMMPKRLKKIHYRFSYH